jgi:hypothetical protein
MAGVEAERLAGFEPPPHTCVTDRKLARMYAETVVVHPKALDSSLDYCTVEAAALLETNFDIVVALAWALQVLGTIDAEQIDIVVATVVDRSDHEHELQRRAAWRELILRDPERALRCGDAADSGTS